MLNNSLPEIFSALITLMIAFTFHEYAHAWTASKFGDDTPSLFGRLTLNPLSHLDLVGSLMLVLTGFGWAKPVPINPHKIRRHSPSALMLVAMSGPLTNFLLAVLAAIPLRFGWVPVTNSLFSFLPTPYQFTLYFFYTNLGLMVFNLLPFPPLDGEEILLYFLPTDWQIKWENVVRPYGPYLLLFLLFFGPMMGFSIIDSVLTPLIYGMARLLLGGF